MRFTVYTFALPRDSNDFLILALEHHFLNVVFDKMLQVLIFLNIIEIKVLLAIEKQ